MPRLSLPETVETKVEFVLSVPLDLMNAMYFTHLVGEADGIDGWPAETRKQIEPGLLEELDFLFTFPKGQPGLMGQFGDHLWAHPETWGNVNALIDYLRKMPSGIGESISNPGIQGLTFYSVCFDIGVESDEGAGSSPRDTFVSQLETIGADVEASLRLFDDPEQLRSRMIDLIEAFYEQHYRDDEARRLRVLERSCAAHRNEQVSDPVELAKELSGRTIPCLADSCSDGFEKLYFAPSLDVGVYVSCSNLGSIHGLMYACEPEFDEEATDLTPDTRRLARIYKALGDEQRLRILHMLHDHEMYAQKIVERTGLHQSVVSRHLSFMAAVGLLSARREGNMKFFSVNPEMRETLSQTTDLFKAPIPAQVD